MNTNKVLCCMTFLVLFLATDLKGQRGIPALFPDTISFQNLSICNESIVPVLKCIDSCWACSSFSAPAGTTSKQGADNIYLIKTNSFKTMHNQSIIHININN